jgi:hypothetical protein
MHFYTQDSPRPGLGGSHHLPPYSILYSSPPRLHPNGSFSRDSQVGVPKLSRVGVSGLWTVIAPHPKLGSGQALNQSCNTRRELSNAMLHSLRRRRKKVDSWLLVVGSQTGNLTPGPSFAHNLGCRCPNGQCKAILDIYASRAFHWYKERTKVRRFDPLKSSSEFSGVREDSIFPLLGVWVAFSHLAPKWGCDNVNGPPCSLRKWGCHRCNRSRNHQSIHKIHRSLDVEK